MSRTHPAVKLTLALTMALAFPAAARAQLDDAHCSSGAVGSVRTYLSVDGAFGDPRANDNGKIRLRGWVYIPTGTPPEGGFPVLVFNHGSEDTPAAKCVLADYFVAQKNFILFVPVRRGHTGSTGKYFEDWATEQADLFCPASICTDAMWSQFYRAFVSDYLKQQRQDVNEAVQYIRSNYPKANDSKFAVMGHSFGAIVSLFFNMLEGEKTQAVVSISASAQSWGQTDAGDYWQQQLRDAVRKAKRPTFFLAPKNDASTLPIAELSYEAALDKQRYQATIFSPVPDELLVCSDGSACPCDDPDNPGADQDVSCGDVAHGKFVSDETRVARWAPTVVEFLRRFGVR